MVRLLKMLLLQSCRAALVASVVAAGITGGALAQSWHTVATGLDHPWAVDFMPDGRFIVSERSGSLRIVSPSGNVSAPIVGLPTIAMGGQGGLLDVLLDAEFASNQRLYFCYSEPIADNKSSTALASARFNHELMRLESVRVLFSQLPKVVSGSHFGCRIAQQGAYLYLTTGDRYSYMDEAQNLSNHIGKIIRIYTDGRVPMDNPFVDNPDAQPELWSFGHRNPQGATLDNQGRFWEHEHGPQGGDEINVIEPGKNYGWPVITYGEQYGGGPIGKGLTAQAGMEQPLHYWTPSIAPSGMTFITTDHYGQDWQGNLLVGSLKFGYVARLLLSDDQRHVIQEEKIPVGERVREVAESPNGAIIILTDADNGKLLTLIP